jgi:hypothetical protein
LIDEKIESINLVTLSLSSKTSWGVLDFIVGFSTVLEPAETNFGDFPSEYLDKYKAIC